MQCLSHWLAFGVIALTGILAALNWQTLMTPAAIDLLMMGIDAPLGVVMLVLTALVVAMFFIATLSNQISYLLETRKLLKEIQCVQAIADPSEASRMEDLRQMIAKKFQLLNAQWIKPQPALPAH